MLFYKIRAINDLTKGNNKAQKMTTPITISQLRNMSDQDLEDWGHNGYVGEEVAVFMTYAVNGI
jgi:hypothetical protein